MNHSCLSMAIVFCVVGVASTSRAVQLTISGPITGTINGISLEGALLSGAADSDTGHIALVMENVPPLLVEELAGTNGSLTNFTSIAAREMGNAQSFYSLIEPGGQYHRELQFVWETGETLSVSQTVVLHQDYVEVLEYHYDGEVPSYEPLPSGQPPVIPQSFEHVYTADPNAEGRVANVDAKLSYETPNGIQLCQGNFVVSYDGDEMPFTQALYGENVNYEILSDTAVRYSMDVRFEAYDPPMPGDANGDGTVDLDDLNAVRSHFGAKGYRHEGDANHDNVVDLDDLNDVRNNFGTSGPSVPEPTSLLIAAAAAIGMLTLCRGRRTL